MEFLKQLLVQFSEIAQGKRGDFAAIRQHFTLKDFQFRFFGRRKCALDLFINKFAPSVVFLARPVGLDRFLFRSAFLIARLIFFIAVGKSDCAVREHFEVEIAVPLVPFPEECGVAVWGEAYLRLFNAHIQREEFNKTPGDAKGLLIGGRRAVAIPVGGQVRQPLDLFQNFIDPFGRRIVSRRRPELVVG